MLIQELLFSQARDNPLRPALIRADVKLDYASVCDGVRRVASGLVRLGIRPGERVCIYLNKQIEAVLSYFGVAAAGAIFVPINPSLRPAQVSHILSNCSAVALITTATQAALLSDILDDCLDLQHLVLLEARDRKTLRSSRTSACNWATLTDSSTFVSVPRLDTDAAAILYTSGSTGKPKGVVVSHRNVVSGALSVASYLQNCPEDVILAVLPLTFDAGFSQLTTAFARGASVVLVDHLLPHEVPRAVARYHITGLAGVPLLWTQLARVDWPEKAVSSLRYITSTGGVMPEVTLNLIRRRLPQTQVFLMYGLTEAFRSTYLPPEELDRRPKSIGKAIPNVDILVVRKDGTLCDVNEPGELVHRGPLVSLGYWNDAKGTAERFRQAPHQCAELTLPEIAVWSGDTVMKDENGFLYFVERKDNMIKSSGYRISPTEVEEVIYGTEVVSECVVLGIRHFELGEAIIVVCHTEMPFNSTRAVILNACREVLPSYMIPKEIVFVESLPRNPNGKIDRKQLLTELSDIFEEK